MKRPTIDTLPNKNKKHRFQCIHVFPELTALCPVTKLPDFYTVDLSYEPERNLVELKSLKLYFLNFRNREILHEEITNQILDDFIEAVEPRRVRIVTKVNIRGGLHTSIVREWSRDNGDEEPISDKTSEDED